MGLEKNAWNLCDISELVGGGIRHGFREFVWLSGTGRAHQILARTSRSAVLKMELENLLDLALQSNGVKASISFWRVIASSLKRANH